MPTDQSGISGSFRRELRFEAVGVTDVGRQRKHNEDHVLLRPDLDLFVVADGMGGHNAGDIASRLATTSLRNFYEATENSTVPSDILGSEYAGLKVHARRLAAAILKANRDVFEISSTYRQHHGMGSTVVAAYLERHGAMMHVGHVGDSRCYRMRDGKLELLTHDHSLINDALALKPDLTQEELARLPKNIITRALGMREDVKVDIRSEAVRGGDIFLLCSDGLSGMVVEPEIAKVLRNSADLRNGCELLVTMANDAGGNDNISALLVRIDEGEPEAKRRSLAPAPNRQTSDAFGNVFAGMSSHSSKNAGNDHAEGASASEPMPGTVPQHELSLEGIGDDAAAGSFADTYVDSTAAPHQDLPHQGVFESGGAPEEKTTDAGVANPANVETCRKCNAELEMGNLFCVQCGTRI